jgi:hypothetical protein
MAALSLIIILFYVNYCVKFLIKSRFPTGCCKSIVVLGVAKTLSFFPQCSPPLVPYTPYHTFLPHTFTAHPQCTPILSSLTTHLSVHRPYHTPSPHLFTVHLYRTPLPRTLSIPSPHTLCAYSLRTLSAYTILRHSIHHIETQCTSKPYCQKWFDVLVWQQESKLKKSYPWWSTKNWRTLPNVTRFHYVLCNVFTRTLDIMDIHIVFHPRSLRVDLVVLHPKWRRLFIKLILEITDFFRNFLNTSFLILQLIFKIKFIFSMIHSMY